MSGRQEEEGGYPPPKKKKRKPSSGKVHSCLFCNHIFRRNRELETHMNTHTGERPHPCLECDLYFNAGNKLWDHRQTVHLGVKRTCEFCGKEFNNLANLCSHRRTVHKLEWKQRRNSSTSSTCNRLSEIVKMIVIDKKGQSSSVAAPPPPQPEEKVISIFEPIPEPPEEKESEAEEEDESDEKDIYIPEEKEDEAEEPVESEEDDIYIPEKKKRRVQKMKMVNESEWRCDICGKILNREYSLVRHKAHVHRPGKAPPRKKEEKQKRFWKCSICGKQFYRKDDYSLKRHKANVHRDLTLSASKKCDDGTEEYKPTGKIWRCYVCGEGFERGDLLRNHKRAVHERGNLSAEQKPPPSSPRDEGTVEASPPPKSIASSKNNLKRFANKKKRKGWIDTRKKRFWKCDLCDCSFYGRDRGTLNRHLKNVHFLSEEDPDLFRSMLSQTQESKRFWKCHLCGKVFQCKDRHTLYRHLRNVHGEKNPTRKIHQPITPPASPPPPPPPPSRKRLQQRQPSRPIQVAPTKKVKFSKRNDYKKKRLWNCDICGKRFYCTSRFNLNRHIRSVHSIESPTDSEEEEVDFSMEEDIPPSPSQKTDTEDGEDDNEIELLPHLTQPRSQSPSAIHPVFPFLSSFNLFNLQNKKKNGLAKKSWDSSFFLHMNRYNPQDSCDALPTPVVKPLPPPPQPPQHPQEIVKKQALQEALSEEAKPADKDDGESECKKCGKVLASKWGLRRHLKIQDCVKLKNRMGIPMWYWCYFCKKDYSDDRRYKLVEHIAAVHRYQEPPLTQQQLTARCRGGLRKFVDYSCAFCGDTFKKKGDIREHILEKHMTQLGTPRDEKENGEAMREKSVQVLVPNEDNDRKEAVLILVSSLPSIDNTLPESPPPTAEVEEIVEIIDISSPASVSVESEESQISEIRSLPPDLSQENLLNEEQKTDKHLDALQAAVIPENPLLIRIESNSEEEEQVSTSDIILLETSSSAMPTNEPSSSRPTPVPLLSPPTSTSVAPVISLPVTITSNQADSFPVATTSTVHVRTDHEDFLSAMRSICPLSSHQPSIFISPRPSLSTSVTDLPSPPLVSFHNANSEEKESAAQEQFQHPIFHPLDSQFGESQEEVDETLLRAMRYVFQLDSSPQRSPDLVVLSSNTLKEVSPPPELRTTSSSIPSSFHNFLHDHQYAALPDRKQEADKNENEEQLGSGSDHILNGLLPLPKITTLSSTPPSSPKSLQGYQSQDAGSPGRMQESNKTEGEDQPGSVSDNILIVSPLPSEIITASSSSPPSSSPKFRLDHQDAAFPDMKEAEKNERKELSGSVSNNVLIEFSSPPNITLSTTPSSSPKSQHHDQDAVQKHEASKNEREGQPHSASLCAHDDANASTLITQEELSSSPIQQAIATSCLDKLPDESPCLQNDIKDNLPSEDNAGNSVKQSSAACTASEVEPTSRQQSETNGSSLFSSPPTKGTSVQGLCTKGLSTSSAPPSSPKYHHDDDQDAEQKQGVDTNEGQLQASSCNISADTEDNANVPPSTTSSYPHSPEGLESSSTDPAITTACFDKLPDENQEEIHVVQNNNIDSPSSDEGTICSVDQSSTDQVCLSRTPDHHSGLASSSPDQKEDPDKNDGEEQQPPSISVTNESDMGEVAMVTPTKAQSLSQFPEELASTAASSGEEAIISSYLDKLHVDKTYEKQDSGNDNGDNPSSGDDTISSAEESPFIDRAYSEQVFAYCTPPSLPPVASEMEPTSGYKTDTSAGSLLDSPMTLVTSVHTSCRNVLALLNTLDAESDFTLVPEREICPSSQPSLSFPTASPYQNEKGAVEVPPTAPPLLEQMPVNTSAEISSQLTIQSGSSPLPAPTTKSISLVIPEPIGTVQEAVELKELVNNEEDKQLSLGSPAPTLTPAVGVDDNWEENLLDDDIEMPILTPEVIVVIKREEEAICLEPEGITSPVAQPQCQKCGKGFASNKSLNRHKTWVADCLALKERTDKPVKSFLHMCSFCNRNFHHRRSHLVRHIARVHRVDPPEDLRINDLNVVGCGFCSKYCNDFYQLEKHILSEHLEKIRQEKKS